MIPFNQARKERLSPPLSLPLSPPLSLPLSRKMAQHDKIRPLNIALSGNYKKRVK